MASSEAPCQLGGQRSAGKLPSAHGQQPQRVSGPPQAVTQTTARAQFTGGQPASQAPGAESGPPTGSGSGRRARGAPGDDAGVRGWGAGATAGGGFVGGAAPCVGSGGAPSLTPPKVHAASGRVAASATASRLARLEALAFGVEGEVDMGGVPPGAYVLAPCVGASRSGSMGGRARRACLRRGVLHRPPARAAASSRVVGSISGRRRGARRRRWRTDR